MAEKLRELRGFFSKNSFRLLPLKGRLEKEVVANAPAPAKELQGAKLQAFLCDTADAHQSEYVSASNKRRAFLTGFTGSAGTALVTADKALLWTDGRYFLQAEQQLSDEWTLMRSEEPDVPTLEKWSADNLKPEDGFFAVDPFLTSVASARKLMDALKDEKIEMVSIQESENLVDTVWKKHRRPECPKSQVTFLPVEYTGRTVTQKLEELREAVAEKKADAIVLTALDDIAWLFNIRGNDIEFNPVVTSYAFVTKDQATLFVDAANDKEVREQMAKDNVVCKPYNAIQEHLQAFAKENASSKVLVDPLQCNLAVFLALPITMRKEEVSLVMKQKAIKNEVEIEGMRQAHIRDGAALTRFFAWLEKQLLAGKQLSEVEAADQEQKFREQMKDFVSLSFDTISSIGSNGAIIHYKPERGTCRQLNTKEMYLNDSGAQYRDGTTDVTRTMHFGQPTQYEKDCFTHVLKAHIALAMAIFPEKVEGIKLDAITRAPLWRVGLDYRHGTGHGVGAFLNVHEKGVGMSFRLSYQAIPMQEKMIVSNEPGYYEPGAFGIRIENLMVVKKADHIKSPMGRDFCKFETITMAPIQQKLINKSLLTTDEITWLNAYHQQVYANLHPLLKDDVDAEAFLKRETEPLALS